MKKTYPTEVGYILLGLILIVFGSIYGSIAVNAKMESSFFISLSIPLLIFLYLLYLNFYTFYIIDNNTLTVKCGFFYKKEYAISSIKSIEKSNSLLSSPAPSLKRVEIIFAGGDSILISPKNREDFAESLCQIKPEIINKVKD